MLRKQVLWCFMKVIIAVPIFVLHDHKMIIHTEHMMCMDLLASIRSHRCFVETYSYMYIGTNIYIDNIMYKHIHKVVWTTYFVSLYPIPNPCFPFCFCVFSGSLRVGPDSHKGPVARSGSNRWICENISEGHRPQGPGSSVKWPKLYVACLCHLYISGFQLLHSIASTVFQVFWRDYRLWSQLPPNRSGNIAQSRERFHFAIPKLPGLNKPRQHIKLDVMSPGLNYLYRHIGMWIFSWLHKLA